MTNLTPYAIAWAVLGAIVAALALMRRSVSSHEDDSIHLSAGSTAVSEQLTTARKLEGIDKWGKILTIVLVVTGVILVAMYSLAVWESTSRGSF